MGGEPSVLRSELIGNNIVSHSSSYNNNLATDSEKKREYHCILSSKLRDIKVKSYGEIHTLKGRGITQAVKTDGRKHDHLDHSRYISR